MPAVAGMTERKEVLTGRHFSEGGTKSAQGSFEAHSAARRANHREVIRNPAFIGEKIKRGRRDYSLSH